MKTIAISEFKAKALSILNQISQDREEIVITKRGKPVAQIRPFQKDAQSCKAGRLSDTLVFEKDIITPLGEDMWDAGK